MENTTDPTTVAMVARESQPWELRYTYPVTALLSVSYATIFIAGLLGNFAVITIVLRNHHMRSVTNIFICNLSVADLLVTVFVEPLTLLQNVVVGWHWGAAACWCVPYLQGISVCASSLSLLVIALDRYLAVCFPMKRLIRRSLAKKIIAVIWLISACLFIPWAYYFRLTRDSTGRIHCIEFWPSVTANRAFFLGVVTLLVYTAPLLIMAYCYCSIIFRIWMRVRQDQINSSNSPTTDNDTSRSKEKTPPPMNELISDPDRETGSDTYCYTERRRSDSKPNSNYAGSQFLKVDDHSRKVRLQPVGGLNRVKTMKIIKMLAIVVINFCICWLPLFTIFNILKFSPALDATNAPMNASSSGLEEDLGTASTPQSTDEEYDALLRVLFCLVPFAQLLGSANSCVNPWIYCFYSKRYRRGFKRVFLCRPLRAASTRGPPRPQPNAVNFHREHNLALRSVDQSACI